MVNLLSRSSGLLKQNPYVHVYYFEKLQISIQCIMYIYLHTYPILQEKLEAEKCKDQQ